MPDLALTGDSQVIYRLLDYDARRSPCLQGPTLQPLRPHRQSAVQPEPAGDPGAAGARGAYRRFAGDRDWRVTGQYVATSPRSEEHTSELQSRQYLVCRLLLEKKKT